MAIVAHEYGHNVQAEVDHSGFDRPLRTVELEADSLAGYWMADALAQGLVTPVDVNGAVVQMAAMGDAEQDPAESHGSPAERVAAFRFGMQAASLDEVLARYR